MTLPAFYIMVDLAQKFDIRELEENNIPIDCHINNFTALSVVGVLQYVFLPLAL